MIIDVLCDKIDLNYLKFTLENTISEGNFEYEAKLYSRVKELFVSIPIEQNKEFDVNRQEDISAAFMRFNTVRQKLSEMGQWSLDVRFKA